MIGIGLVGGRPQFRPALTPITEVDPIGWTGIGLS
jgi:hypothetical protein